MNLPCEIFAKKYLPSVRARMVYILYKKYQLNQKDISEILDITQPAVSQYLTGVRGRGAELPEKIIKIIDEQTDRIYEMYKKGKVDSKFLKDVYCIICRSIMGQHI